MGSTASRVENIEDVEERYLVARHRLEYARQRQARSILWTLGKWILLFLVWPLALLFFIGRFIWRRLSADAAPAAVAAPAPAAVAPPVSVAPVVGPSVHDVSSLLTEYTALSHTESVLLAQVHAGGAPAQAAVSTLVSVRQLMAQVRAHLLACGIAQPHLLLHTHSHTHAAPPPPPALLAGAGAAAPAPAGSGRGRSANAPRGNAHGGVKARAGSKTPVRGTSKSSKGKSKAA